MSSRIGRLPFGSSYRYESYRPGDYLEAGEVYGFMSVAIPFASLRNVKSLSRNPTDMVQEVLDQHSFVFCYCSVYEEDCGQVYLGAAPPEEADVCDF